MKTDQKHVARIIVKLPKKENDYSIFVLSQKIPGT